MKTFFSTLPKLPTAISCFVLLLSGNYADAQDATNTVSNIEIFYYGFAFVIIVLIIATVLIMRKAHKILGEHGQPLFDSNNSIFRRMTKSSTTVAVIMILLILWGIYLVLTYKVP